MDINWIMRTTNNFNHPFDREAKKHFPFLNKRVIKTNKGRKIEYKLTLDVRCYGKRKIRILIDNLSPKVTCDGPARSKHRYRDGSLCMWYPNDSDEDKWVFEDGLLNLIRMIEAHLFREAYWREKGVWLGPEHDHSGEPK